MQSEQIFKSQYQIGSDNKFEPNADLADKQNYSRHIFIARDGAISEVIRLNILDDRQREDIIGFHFAQQYAEIHYGKREEQPEFYVIGRDNPWDFEYAMHDASTFFLEICRVADQDLLKAIRAENDVMSLLAKPSLRGFEVQKIEKHFPGTLPKNLTEAVRTKSDKKRLFPLDKTVGGPRVFLRPPMNPRLDLKAALEEALRKKAAKRHACKEDTIIVLDNLTTHSDPKDFFDAIANMSDFLEKLPFKSVWLYTGYYSGDDGYECEYSLIPIKLTDEETLHLEAQLN